MVESQPSKLLVAGSIPVSRSIHRRALEILARFGAMSRRSATREGGQTSLAGFADELRLGRLCGRVGKFCAGASGAIGAPRAEALSGGQGPRIKEEEPASPKR